VTYPKIELHVHLEGTVRPETLLEIARRNGYALPVDSVEGIRALYEYRDFAHFIEVFMLTSAALEREDDFRQITVEYAEEAARHGAVYLEAIFALGLWRGSTATSSSAASATALRRRATATGSRSA
jgi:aminodeoxyfutalosine deaminase